MDNLQDISNTIMQIKNKGLYSIKNEISNNVTFMLTLEGEVLS